MSYSPSYSLQLTHCHSCQLGHTYHPPPHRHYTHHVLLALVLAASVLTTIVLIASVLAVSYSSSHLIIWYNILLFLTL